MASAETLYVQRGQKLRPSRPARGAVRKHALQSQTSRCGGSSGIHVTTACQVASRADWNGLFGDFAL